MIKKGLGRGLQALIPTKEEVKTDGSVMEIDISLINVNENQPRKFFSEDKLAELAASIKEHGVVQPIVVRPGGDGSYELVAGERRWRACRKLGIKRIPAVVKDVSEREMAEIALIENIQREDLNPVEEAVAYKALIEEYGLTQEDLSSRVGKSRPFIANTIRLLNLPAEILDMVRENRLSAGHARALLGLNSKMDQIELAKQIAARGLSVRQTEQTIKKGLHVTTHKKTPSRPEPILSAVEEKLRNKFSTQVKIRAGKKSGKIEIDYYDQGDLERIVDILLECDEI
jgi:ParB family chromosome partitioning protein